MTALECLQAASARLPGSRIEGYALMIGDQCVATVSRLDTHVTVRHAAVFNGFNHEIPPGCDDCVTTPRRHKDPVGRVVKAIEERQAARATSLPLPEAGPSRSPEEVACVA